MHDLEAFGILLDIMPFEGDSLITQELLRALAVVAPSRAVNLDLPVHVCELPPSGRVANILPVPHRGTALRGEAPRVVSPAPPERAVAPGRTAAYSGRGGGPTDASGSRKDNGVRLAAA